jgi:putative flippase GtrA
MKSIVNKKEQLRFLRFSIVGVIGSLIDFGVMNLLSHLLHFSLALSGSISFFCAVLSNFIWNRFWTYPDSRSKPLHKQLSMFALVSIVGIFIRLIIIFLLETPLRNYLYIHEVATGLGDILAKNITLALSIGIVLLWNFLANRFWTYNDIDKVTT